MSTTNLNVVASLPGSNAKSLQEQYEQALKAAEQAAANQQMNTQAYYAKINSIINGPGSAEQKLFELLALISGDGAKDGRGNGGLQTQEDAVTTYAAQTNVNTALGKIIADATSQVQNAYNVDPTGTGGMTAAQAGEFKNDWMNAVKNIKDQIANSKPGSPAYEQGESMLKSLMDIQTQLGINIASSSPQTIASTFNSLATNEANGNDSNPDGNGTSSGPLSAINNDLAQLNTTLSSSSATTNSLMQFVMSLIQELQPFVNAGFEQLGRMTKTMVSNQVSR